MDSDTKVFAIGMASVVSIGIVSIVAISLNLKKKIGS